MSARIAETTKTRKRITSEPTKIQTGLKGQAMTLQKAIELVERFVKDTGNVCDSPLLDPDEADNMREFDNALMVLLETAKDVLRCEDDGK